VKVAEGAERIGNGQQYRQQHECDNHDRRVSHWTTGVAGH